MMAISTGKARKQVISDDPTTFSYGFIWYHIVSWPVIRLKEAPRASLRCIEVLHAGVHLLLHLLLRDRGVPTRSAVQRKGAAIHEVHQDELLHATQP